MANPEASAKPPSHRPRMRPRRPAPTHAAAQRPYDRRRELPRVLPLWPHELDNETLPGRRLILAKLRRALRAERCRGLSGHWTYDLSRHVALLRVYRLELAESKATGGRQ
jgi:hypothetical protein